MLSRHIARTILRRMVLQMDRTPLCVTEGRATDWEPHFCWIPTRLFTVMKGHDGWAWLSTVERRYCKTANWLHPGPAYWVEYRKPAELETNHAQP